MSKNYPFDEGGLVDLSDIFIPGRYRKALEQLADRKGIKVSYLVREIITGYLKTQGRIFEKMETDMIGLWLRSKQAGIPMETLAALEKAREG